MVTEELSGEHQFKSLAIASGWWRGAYDKINGVRECRNSVSAWQHACVGGTEFAEEGDSYCLEGYTGPLCSLWCVARGPIETRFIILKYTRKPLSKPSFPTFA